MATAPRKSTGGRGPARIVSHKLEFNAHDGSPAVMVSHGSPTISLPYLYTFAFYITNPKITRDEFDSVKLYEQCLFSAPYMEPFRFDFYFLPEASIEDCQAHYMAEKEARGSIDVQVEAIQRGEPPKNQGDIPGMVPSYLSLPNHWYEDILVVGDRDWQTEGMLLVQFNLPLPEECGIYEEELQDYSPTRVTRLEVGEDGKMPDTMQRRLFEIMYVEEMGWPWDKAVELGYATW
ncbi:hypothetical protein OQA88_10289 [Cercophora sp. LCS_1]